MNTSERQYKADLLMLALIEPEAVNDRVHTVSELSEYDEAIAEYRGMLDYYISVNNKEQTSVWKRELQKVKTEKRMIREMLQKGISEAEVLTT